MTTLKTFYADTVRPFFQSDRAMLLVCVGLALFFWLLIKLSKRFPSSVEIGIHYNLPQGKTFRVFPPRTLNANIEGTGWDLMSNYFTGRQSNMVINLTEESKQDFYQSFLMTKLAKDLDAKNIDILNINLDAIHVELDDEVVKKVPLTFDGEIGFASSYYYRDSLRLIPDSVSITGPVEVLDSIKSWKTEFAKLEKLSEDTRQQVALSQQKNANIVLQPQNIELYIPVEQYTEKSLFVPISVINAADSVRIFPESVKLSFMVGVSRFNSIQSHDFVIEANAAANLNQSTSLALHLMQYPKSLRSIKINPKSVEYVVLKTNAVEEEKE